MLTGSPAASLLARDVDLAIRPEHSPGGGFVLEQSFRVPFGLYASAELRREPRVAAVREFVIETFAGQSEHAGSGRGAGGRPA